MKPPSAPVPATLAAFYRMMVAALLPLGVQKGWWGQSDVVNISALLIAAGHVVWALVKTHDRQTRLNNSAPIGRSVIRPKE